MLVVKAQLTITDKHRTAFLAHMRGLVEASLNEAGCISFDCYEEVNAPNSFIVLQEWHNAAALERHEQSEHVAAFKANAASMIVSRQPTRVYTVSQVGGLDTLKDIDEYKFVSSE